MPLVLAILLRFLRAGEPEPHLEVTLSSSAQGYSATAETDSMGVVRFTDALPGSYRWNAGSISRDFLLTSELETLTIDLEAPPVEGGRFGRSEVAREELSRLPQASTISNYLETIEPFAVTDRIDTAGVEGATDPRWSSRGSSWTQNRILLDGIDITDPSGGAPLLYPDLAFFEELSLASSANPVTAAGPGTELSLVTRAPPEAFHASLGFRYSGSSLQSDNRSEYQKALGIEPREMLRFPAGHATIGGPGFFAAMNGFDLETRVPHFDPVEKTSLFGAAAKVNRGHWSLLAIAQHLSRPTFGARPYSSASAILDAEESFQVAQASFDRGPLSLRLGFARGDLESDHSGSVTPIRDLATSAIDDAPPRVLDRTRSRWEGAGRADFSYGRHALQAGFEIAHAREDLRESAPGSMERLTVDGTPHAVSFFDSAARSEVGIDRLALHLQDGFFLDFLGLPFRLAPGVRLDLSRSESIRWSSLSGAISGAVLVRPSVVIHFSAGRYPHLLTTRLAATESTLSSTWRRWTDANADLQASPDEIGAVLRRNGGSVTTIDPDLPRPYVQEVTIGVEKRFANGFLRFSGYHRREKRLLQTVNLGIAPSSYETFEVLDVGVDGVLGSGDDRRIPVHDQTAQLGEDRFLLAHPEGLDSYAQGVDLLLGFRHGRFSWRLSGRAYRDVGRGNVGNEPFENDTGIPGDLFDDPNTLTSSEGRLYFDRAFTGKLALTARGPKAFDLGVAVRYWDGLPFARQLYFPGLGQGFRIVQAFPRGRLRFAFSMTVDVRVERELELGWGRILLAVDAFNLFDQRQHTNENVRTGETFREPTFVQPGRTVALEGRLRF